MILSLATASSQSLQINIYFLAAFIGVATGVLMIWQWIRDRHKKYIDQAIKDKLEQALKGFSEEITKRIESSIRDEVDESYHKVKEEFLDSLDRRVTVMETKVEVFWQRIAVDVAKVLHHPEPSRARVDELLEVLMSGSMTSEDARELCGYLEIIRDWEPGNKAPFTVFQGEQVAAAILLHAMDYVVDKEQ